MGIVNVAHLEAGALTRQTAGIESRHTALVSHFGQRIGLVMNCDRAFVPKKVLITDEIVLALIRSIGVNTSLSRTFMRSRIVRPYGQTHAELIVELLADRTHAAVRQMVDIIHVGL